jgi:hypothetical protein
LDICVVVGNCRAIQNFKDPADLHDLLDIKDSTIPALNEAKPTGLAAAAAATAAGNVCRQQQQHFMNHSSSDSGATIDPKSPAGFAGSSASAGAGAAGAAAGGASAVAGCSDSSVQSSKMQPIDQRLSFGSSCCSSSSRSSVGQPEIADRHESAITPISLPEQQHHQDSHKQNATSGPSVVKAALTRLQHIRQGHVMQRQQQCLAAAAAAATGDTGGSRTQLSCMLQLQAAATSPASGAAVPPDDVWGQLGLLKW